MMLLGIDVGSHKICSLLGESLPGGGVRILGIGHAPASGIRRGEVVHVEDAAGAIAASIERAERLSGVRAERAIVGVTGTHLAGQNRDAVIPLGRRPRAVEQSDMDRALESAGALPLGVEREVLHVLPRAFRLDDGSTVVSPLGMAGYQLAAEVHIVTASSAALANLRRCLELAEVGPSELVMSTLAAGEATVTADERELGAFVVDVGTQSTGLACYHESTVIHSAELPIGGRHMTNDLAVMLQVPLAQAERIKTTHGHVLPEYDGDDAAIDIVPFGEAQVRSTTRRHVSEVLAARAEELAVLVMAELERVDLAGRLPAGGILVGGGTELGGLPRFFYERWGVPVRVGRPMDVLGLADAARGPAHAGAVGLLLWHARGVVDAVHLTPAPAPNHSGGAGMARALAWAKQAFLPGRSER